MRLGADSGASSGRGVGVAEERGGRSVAKGGDVGAFCAPGEHPEASEALHARSEAHPEPARVPRIRPQPREARRRPRRYKGGAASAASRPGFPRRLDITTIYAQPKSLLPRVARGVLYSRGIAWIFR